MKRLQNRELDEHRIERHRHIHEPEIVGTEEEEISAHFETTDNDNVMKNVRRWESSEEEDEAEDLDEDDIEHRRMIARQKAVIKQQEEVSKHKIIRKIKKKPFTFVFVFYLRNCWQEKKKKKVRKMKMKKPQNMKNIQVIVNILIK